MPIDFDDPAAALDALVRARASTDGSDSVIWFRGEVWAWVPGEQQRPLWGFEGYNVGRVEAVEGGYDLLTREAAFYQDLGTGDVLDRWPNPYTEADVEVVAVWNDPVNQRFRLDGPRGPFRLSVTPCGDDLAITIDVYLTYPSPLRRDEFPESSQSDTYQAAELFQFFCPAGELEDVGVASASTRVSWTRIAPWLPWMAMGDRPGQLVYHCQGAKLPGGYGDLPAWMRQIVDSRAPHYASAPSGWSEPNETSWTYYRKLAAESATR